MSVEEMSRTTPPPREMKHRELKPTELRWTCDPSAHDLSVPSGNGRPIGIIGQDRAIRAMKMGMELYSPGYNVFVCGISGTGRTSTVKKILDNIKSSCPLPLDRCYVHNFKQPDRPRLVVLPRGKGREFRKEMGKFKSAVLTIVRRALDSEDHAKRREKLINRYEQEGDRLIEKFERRAEKEGFALKRVREGEVSRPELFPIVGEQAVPVADLEKLVHEKVLTASQAKGLTKRYVALRGELEAVAKEGRKILEKMESEVATLDRSRLRAALEEPARAIAERYDHETIREHVTDALDHFAQNNEFLALTQASQEPSLENGAGGQRAEREELLDLLDVNVVLDNVGREHCPVVIENLPTYRRLFGYFEKVMDRSGLWATDFRKIRAGSLLKADGGYLVLNAEDVFRLPGVWQSLKRTLVNRALEIYEEGTPLQVPATTMTPEPIAINVKVILIGDKETYNTLYNNDRDFKKIFKVLADFDYEMDLNKKNLRQYAAFVGKMCQEEGLAPFEQGAVAAVAEYGARKAGRQGKLTARFGDISDLLREASYWCRKRGDRRVGPHHVRAALRAAEQRSNLWQEKVREAITTGQLVIEVKGKQVGQINGLQVYDYGSYAFGVPARITATAAPGTAGIINIEREAEYSGRAHDKGVLIIGGFFREKFGRVGPLTLTASIAFEQSYSDVDGDSASATEVFAILSALSGLPIDQCLAVTGSVDQKGAVQPVGGINLKIEGFFQICHARGLNGQQGVIIPESNVSDLMLREEVVEAVRQKKFHVYPIRTVEEGIELLTGRPAGKRTKSGDFPEGTVYGMVENRLREMLETVRKVPPVPKLG